MTYHVGLKEDGTQRMPLWAEITADDALGRDPDYWYWGHCHNGIVYSSASASGAGTRCRCFGNGSIPRAAPTHLDPFMGEGRPVQWDPHTPFDDDVPEHRKRTLNGFATLTFTENELVEHAVDQKGHAMQI